MLKPWNFSLSVFFLAFKFAYHTNKAPFNKSSRQARIRWLWHLWFFYVTAFTRVDARAPYGISNQLLYRHSNPQFSDVDIEPDFESLTQMRDDCRGFQSSMCGNFLLYKRLTCTRGIWKVMNIIHIIIHSNHRKKMKVSIETSGYGGFGGTIF